MLSIISKQLNLSKEQLESINLEWELIKSKFDQLQLTAKVINIKGNTYAILDDLCQCTVTQNIEVKLQKPNDIIPIGSWVQNTLCKSSYEIDIGVLLSKELIDEKDDTNFTYICKRNFYLESFIKNFEKLFNQKFTIDKTHLCWTARVIIQMNVFVFRIVLEEGSLSKSRLIPTKNNVRLADIDYSKLAPTPLYNHVLAKDQFALDVNQKFLKYQNSEGFCDALRLLKTFVKKRSLSISSASLSYLADSVANELGENMSSLQFFKCVMRKIYNNTSLWTIEDKYAFLRLDHLSFDAIPINKFLYLQQQCRFADDSIEIDPHSLFNKYYENWDATILADIPKSVPAFFNSSAKVNTWEYKFFLAGAIERLLKKAIDYINIVNIDIKNNICIKVLLKSKPTPLLRGPPINTKEAASFIQLWGENCEKRKFKDGFVNVCVSFDNDDIHEIINKCLSVHFKDINITSSKIIFPEIKLDSNIKELKDTLKSLDLPLPISHVHHLQLNYFALELETSMSWPDNLIVMQSTKLLYLCKIAKLLPSNYRSKILDNKFLKSINPFSPTQALEITDTTSKSIYQFVLMVDREYTLLEKEQTLKQSKSQYPDLVPPPKYVSSKLSVEVLKRKAGNFSSLDISATIDASKEAWIYIFKQLVAHRRDLSICKDRYPLFETTCLTVFSLLNQKGVLSQLPKTQNLMYDIIEFNSGPLNYCEILVERTCMSVFCHSNPHPNTPHSLESAVTKVLKQINNNPYYDLNGDFVCYNSEFQAFPRCIHDVAGSWFCPGEIADVILQNMLKDLREAAKLSLIDLLSSKPETELFRCMNAKKTEALLYRCFPSAFILKTDNNNRVLSIPINPDSHLQEIQPKSIVRECKRISKTIV
eukprot:NODE_769_length_4037_cov_0.573134.p1 type:complete len:875 gc:universal NODE_769_length_4037_cov_0.573134:3907-1283(-)